MTKSPAKWSNAHRTSLAKGEVGIREKKPSPTLAEFIENRFEPWARGTFEKTSPKTWRDYYKVGIVGIKNIKNYKPLADAKLNGITSETTSGSLLIGEHRAFK